MTRTDGDARAVARREARIGVAYALAAFGFWGLVPVYFKLLGQVPALEILAHRVVWSVVFCAGLATISGRWPAIRSALSSRAVIAPLVASTLFVGTNWLVFIWAVLNDRVLDSSLGYFINPLISVLLGLVLLRERLSRWQGLAVLLAVAAVLTLALVRGRVPWVSLTLAGTFGCYGYIRKVARVGALDGLFVETLLLAPVAVLYLVFWQGAAAFGPGDPMTAGLLVVGGVVTALPLLWFTAGARRLRLATVGLLQYIAPSTQFLLAVFLYREPFTTGDLVAFALIWLALAVYSADSLARARAA